jgi:formylglycine-generating enzyme required for sulfatase activity
MAQGGNVWEWTDSPFYGIPEDGNVQITTLGGSWGLMQEFHIQSSYSGNFNGVFDDLASTYIGFRVAMVPEPSSLSLLVLGGAVVALCRRKRA